MRVSSLETLESKADCPAPAHTQLGMTGVKRVESLNDSPYFIRAIADIAAAHLKSGQAVSAQMGLRCPGCTNERCGKQKEWFEGFQGKIAAPAA